MVQPQQEVQPRPETVLPEAQAEYQAFLEQLAAERNPDVPAGTFIGESALGDGSPGEQGIVRMRKPGTPTTFNGQPMPDRWPVYDRRNEISRVPTKQLQYHLNKTDKHTGQRVFSLKPWPDVAPPEYVVKRVPVYGGGWRERRFPSEAEWELHMQLKHPSVWTSMQRAEDRERQERQIAASEAQSAATIRALEAMVGIAQQAPHAETDDAAEPEAEPAPEAEPPAPKARNRRDGD